MRVPNLILMSLLLFSSACGGGGGGGGDANLLQGVFGAPPVAGITYESTNSHGTTDVNGGFRYRDGDVVLFRIGGTVLGSSLGQPTVTSADLVPGLTIPRRNVDLARLGEPSPAAEFVNRLVFLQTLDADGDLSNGILIPDVAISILVQEVQNQFKRSTAQFEQNLPFRRVLHLAAEQGAWGGTRPPIVHDTKALDAYLRHADEESQFEHVAREEGDLDANGVFDEVTSIAWTDQRTHVYTIDADNNGEPEAIQTRQFTAGGLLLTDDWEVTDHDAAGRLVLLERTPSGDVVRRTVHVGANVERVIHNQLDSMGLAVRSQIDTDGDGTIDETIDITRDEEGRIVREELDEGVDGRIDRVDTHGYDEEGRVETFATRFTAPGGIEFSGTHRYDEAGREVLATLVQDNEIRRTETIYDDVSHIVTKRTTRTVSGMTFKSIEIEHYDAQGRIIRRVRDHDGDGAIDMVVNSVYDGLIQSEETDFGNNGSLERRTIYIRNEAGNLIRVRFDQDADGRTDAMRRFTYVSSTAFQASQVD